MIKTQLVEPEVFINKLLPNGTKQVTTQKTITNGWWRSTQVVDVIEEAQLYKLDELLLATFPPDVANMIRDYTFSKEGYIYSYRFDSWTSERCFTRDFTHTLNEFYIKNNISKANLINLEYCKDGCMIKGAYITWDDGV